MFMAPNTATPETISLSSEPRPGDMFYHIGLTWDEYNELASIARQLPRIGRAS